MPRIRFCDILKRTPRWSILNSFGNSSFAKMTIFMPIIGYMIIFNDDLIKYFRLSSKFVWNETGEPSYRLFFFYFGLSSLGIGSLVFHIFCPSEIKNSPKVEDFVEKEKRIGSGFRMFYLMEKTVRDFRGVRKKVNIIENYITDVMEIFNHFDRKGVRASSHIYSSIVDEKGMKRQTYDDEDGVINEHLKMRWWMKNVEYFEARLTSSLFYVLGFFLLLFPTIHTFALICKAFYIQFFA